MQYNNLFTTRQSRAKPSTKGVGRFILNKLCLSFVKSNLKMKPHSNDSFGMTNTNLAPLQQICHLKKCVCNVVESHGNHVHRFFVGSKFLSLQGNHLLMPARNSHTKKKKRCSKLHSKWGNQSNEVLTVTWVRMFCNIWTSEEPNSESLEGQEVRSAGNSDLGCSTQLLSFLLVLLSNNLQMISLLPWLLLLLLQ